MKVRLCFVSNSSTVSFCIFGIGLSSEEAQNLPSSPNKDLCGLETHFGDPYGEEFVYIGKSWSSIDDNETGKQFKDRVRKAVEKLGLDPSKCTTIEVAYSDR